MTPKEQEENKEELINCPDCGALLLKRPKGYRCPSCGLRINVLRFDSEGNVKHAETI